jgi:uncharacterized radical SAM superfamily Fe-S cluster-containing enzyme
MEKYKAKDKAKEMINTCLLQNIDIISNVNGKPVIFSGNMTHKSARKLCLLVADEFMREYEQYSDLYSKLVPCGTEEVVSIIERSEHWEDVKREINRL